MLRNLSLTFITVILSGLLGIFVLGYLLGDVDDDFWWHFLCFALPAALFSRGIMRIRLGKNVKRIGTCISLITFSVMIIYSIYGVVEGRDIIDGHRYHDMEGMIPYIVGIIAAWPLLASIWFLLVRRVGDSAQQGDAPEPATGADPA